MRVILVVTYLFTYLLVTGGKESQLLLRPTEVQLGLHPQGKYREGNLNTVNLPNLEGRFVGPSLTDYQCPSG